MDSVGVALSLPWCFLEMTMTAALKRKKPAKYPPPKGVPNPTQSPPGNLRLLARSYYCFEHPKVSLAQMNRIWPFNNVSLKTLQNWSSREEWPTRRREAEEVWTARVRAEIGDRIVKDRLDQLAKAERVVSNAQKLLASGLEPKSYEGMVNAWVRASRFLDELREKVVAAIPENSARPENAAPPMDVRLTPEEASAAALTIVRMRREKMRAENAKAESSESRQTG